MNKQTLKVSSIKSTHTFRKVKMTFRKTWFMINLTKNKIANNLMMSLQLSTVKIDRKFISNTIEIQKINRSRKKKSPKMKMWHLSDKTTIILKKIRI